MASLKKPAQNRPSAHQRDSILNALKLFLEGVFSSQTLQTPSLLVAYSGGLDSTVLLHACHLLQTELAFSLSAMHVHHGLSHNADKWAQFCAETCAQLNIPLSVRKVVVDKKSGLGVEAAARSARYQALGAADTDFICLAQHQDDQAETVLLQLARGAGVKGLAGMAQADVSRKIIRPFLGVSRADLERYAKQNRLTWVDDESNFDRQYDRNFIRHEVMTVLRQKYPSIVQALSRSAQHAAEASALLDELAQMDAAHAIDKKQENHKLSLNFLKELSAQRQANLMRWWFAQHGFNMPTALQLQQILQQLLHAKSDAAVKIKISPTYHLMRYQAHAWLVKAAPAPIDINQLWQGEDVVVLSNQARLIFTKTMGQGLAFQRGGSMLKLRIKSRQGGERFKSEYGRPSRTLKYMLQTSNMPPWQRAHLPLVFMDETLVYIPNLGPNAELRAGENEMGCVITWQQAVGGEDES